MKCDWMIFRNAKTNKLGCLPVGAKAANRVSERIIKVINGTERDAINEIRRIELENIKS